MPLKHTGKLPRNYANALTMIGRKSGTFKDKSKGRGGARNDQNDLLAEYEEARLAEQETDDEES